jgi:hypothetical protein
MLMDTTTSVTKLVSSLCNEGTFIDVLTHEDVYDGHKIIVEYIKDGNGRKVGCFCGTLVDDEIRIGYSKFAKARELVSFDKCLAREIAIGRMLKSKCLNLPPSLDKRYKKFLDRCRRYFKKSV